MKYVHRFLGTELRLGRTDLASAYTISPGFGVATGLNGIPIRFKVHDKHPLNETLDRFNQCLRTAIDVYGDDTARTASFPLTIPARSIINNIGNCLFMLLSSVLFIY